MNWQQRYSKRTLESESEFCLMRWNLAKNFPSAHCTSCRSKYMMGACAYPAQSVVRSSHRTWVPFNLFLTICICQSKKKSFHRQNMHGAASRDDSRLQNSRLFFSISVSSVAQEPHTLSRVSLSVLLFMEGKRDKEPSSLQIKVQF